MDDGLSMESILDVPEAPKGLNIVTTCVFIVGVIAGSGFLALPKAIDNAGWVGFGLMIICCFTSAYTGQLLGKCWVIVRSRNPIYQQSHVRYPYPAIGHAAYGRFGRVLVSFSINFTMFGGSIVYTLLGAENIHQLFPSDTKFSLCFVAVIIAAVLAPITWLGTPKDFWGIAAGATIATGTASIIMLVDVVRTGHNVHDVKHTSVDFVSFFTAFGTIVFAFGGHPAFPTFQADMKEQKNFGKACLLGYLIVLFMYLPTSVASYFKYGIDVKANVLGTVPGGGMQYTVSVLMTAHLLLGIIIILNPVSQELEHFFNIPEHFTKKRVISRTLTMAAVLFIAETIPHFSSILALVGGSTVTILAYICPPLFYMKLCNEKHYEKIPIPLHMKVLNYELVFIGVVAGIASTYSAISDLIENKFTVPCYVNPYNITT